MDIQIFLWAALLAVIGLMSMIGMTHRRRGRHSDELSVRREVIDECFAKGSMTREECEGKCTPLDDCRASKPKLFRDWDVALFAPITRRK